MTDATAPTASTQPPPGRFCDEHWSWLCQAGEGQCSAVSAPVDGDS